MEGCGWQGYSGFYGTQIKAFARVAFFRLTVCVRRHFAGCCVAFQMLASRQKIVFNYRSFLLQLTSEDSCGILSGRVRKKRKVVRNTIFQYFKYLTCCLRIVISSPPMGPKPSNSASLAIVHSANSRNEINKAFQWSELFSRRFLQRKMSRNYLAGCCILMFDVSS